jgi:hypothetical protein
LTFVISRGLPTWEGPYNCRGCADPVYLSDRDLQIPFLFELLKGEGEHTIVCPTSLLGGLSTTPSSIGALEKSIVEEACGNTDSNFFALRPQNSTQTRKFEIW